jgi:cellulose synthase operon protein C
VAVATVAVVAGVGLLVLALPPIARRAHALLAARSLFAPLARNPYRRNDLRLTYALADHHRPRSVLRRDEPAPPQEEFRYSHVSLARLERGGDQHGIAAAYALADDLTRARQILESLLARKGTDQTSGKLAVDLAAVLAWDGLGPGRAQALRLLDGVLRRQPDHPQAMWNRAVLLESLDLPVAAARQFGAVAGLREPGWAGEAAARADRLQKRWNHGLARQQAASDAANALARRGELPPEELAGAYPDIIRQGVYRGIRAADTSEKAARMVEVADRVDVLQGGNALGELAREPALELKFAELLEQPLTLETARQFQNMAREVGDRWRELKAWALIADVHRRGGAPEEARAALEAGLDLAKDSSFPALTLELADALALVHNEARDMQQAQRIALSMKRESQVRALPGWELLANERLLRVEEVRHAWSLARAFAEENAWQAFDAQARWRAQHLLALLARGESELGEAREHLRKLQTMERPRGYPPFDYSVAALVQELIQRGKVGDWPDAPELLRQTLAFYEGQASLSGYRRAYLPIIRGRMLLATGDREGGRQQLNEALRRVVAMKDAGSFEERIEVPAYSALAIDAATNGDHPRAFAHLARLRGMTLIPGGCLVGVVEEHQRRIFIVRGPGDRTYTTIQAPSSAREPRRPAPPEIAASFAGCDSVAVLAVVPVFGQPGLLPPELPWAYVYGDPRAAADADRSRRLVVTDVRPPEELELPRLAPQPTTATHRREQVVALVGWQATPSRVLAEMPLADEIALHVHGVMLPEVSDVPALVFSADDSGRALLTLRDLAGLRLPRHPAVILGACHAARGAPYGSVHASLPAAFLKGGARLVFAAASPIEDSEAGQFFEGVRRRMAAGAGPAPALRDERQSPRWFHHGPHWTRDVVLFQ